MITFSDTAEQHRIESVAVFVIPREWLCLYFHVLQVSYTLLVVMTAPRGSVSALWSVIMQPRTSGRWSQRCPAGGVEQVRFVPFLNLIKYDKVSSGQTNCDFFHIDRLNGTGIQ